MEKGKNIVEQIVDLWCSITGTDLNSKEYTFSVGQEFNLSTAREDLMVATHKTVSTNKLK